MKQLFEQIFNQYESLAKKKKVKYPLLEEDLPQQIQTSIKLNQAKYEVNGSSGKGRWAAVPWIGIFDKEISITAMEGYDIVYLFCADMSGVYLSLNQGWTYFDKKYKKNAKPAIKIVTAEWKDRLSSVLQDFNFDEIDLRAAEAKSKLPKGYELGHICGKYYAANDLPEDAVFVDDLRNLLGVFRELKGKMINKSFEKTNDAILTGLEPAEFATSLKSQNYIDEILSGKLKVELTETAKPEKVRQPENKGSGSPRHVDFKAKQRNQKKVGDAAEISVCHHEKNSLEKAGRSDLAKQVRHVAKEDGDGAGYDVLSFMADGKENH